MFLTCWYFLFVLIGVAICSEITPYDVKIVSYSTDDGILDISKARLIGRERLMNGTFTFKEDMDNEHYSVSFECFLDPVGDGNFKLLPFHVSRMPICEAFRKYRPLFSKDSDYGRHTDFPIHRDTCPLPKGTYYAKDLQISSENWPAIIPRGYIRGNLSYYRGNEHVGNYSATVIITDKKSR